MEITENITNIGALRAFIADLPDDLEINIDSVEKTGFVCGPITMTKTIWDVDDLDSEVISVYGIISDPDETWLPDDVEALYNFDAMLEEIKAKIVVR